MVAPAPTETSERDARPGGVCSIPGRIPKFSRQTYARCRKPAKLTAAGYTLQAQLDVILQSKAGLLGRNDPRPRNRLR